MSTKDIFHVFMFCTLDIRECDGTHNCDTNAQCMEEQGSFSCQCNTGFTGNGTTCVGM